MLDKIAVTGGLSCGKSSLCRFLSDFGAHVVSADEIVHQLLRSPHTAIGKRVVALLGPDIVINGAIDRRAIAKKVFTERALLSSLEDILHPAVQEETDKRYDLLKEQEHKNHNDKNKKSLFIVEIPLLFETGREKNFDYTVAVVAPEEQCISRFIKATGLTEADYNNRKANQFSQEEKGRRADFIIENNGSLEDLGRNAGILYKNILNQ